MTSGKTRTLVAAEQIIIAKTDQNQSRLQPIRRLAPEARLCPETQIVIRRHWNDYRKGIVPLRCIQRLHWGYWSGGIGTTSPNLMMMGYIWCTDLISGEIAHSCAHGPAPHQIKVTIVQKDNDKALVRALKKLAR